MEELLFAALIIVVVPCCFLYLIYDKLKSKIRALEHRVDVLESVATHTENDSAQRPSASPVGKPDRDMTPTPSQADIPRPHTISTIASEDHAERHSPLTEPQSHGDRAHTTPPTTIGTTAEDGPQLVEPVSDTEPTSIPPTTEDDAWPPALNTGKAITNAIPPARNHDGDFEFKVGGKYLNRIGAVAILLGTLFFVKYAFDNDWVTPLMRVLIGAVTGLILIGIAERTHRRNMAIFSQGVAGAALPILYLSIYASYSFYQLIPHTPAFVMMCVVTVTGLWLSLRYSSPFIALLSAVVGMATPALLSTGTMDTAGLFTYISLLTISLLAYEARAHSHRIISSVVVVGVWSWWALWYGVMTRESIMAEQYVAGFFAVLFGVLWLGFDIVAGRSPSRTIVLVDRMFDILNCAAWVLLMDYVWNPQSVWADELTIGFTTLAYGCAAWFTERRHPRSNGASSTFICLAITTAVFACSYEPTLYAAVRSIFVVSVVGIVVARWRGLQAPAYASLFFLCISVVTILVQPYTRGSSAGKLVFLFNERFGTLLLASACLYLSTGFLRRMDDRLLSPMMSLLQPVSFLVLVFAINTEIQYLFLDHPTLFFHRDVTTSSICVMLGASLLWLGRRFSTDAMQHAGAIVIAVNLVKWMLVGSEYAPLADYTLLLNIRVLTALVIVLCIICLWRWHDGIGFRITKPYWNGIMGILFVVVTFYLASTEAITPYLARIERSTSTIETIDLHNALQLTLSGIWMCYAGLLLTTGFIRRLRAARIGGIVLLGVAVLKVFLWDLSFLRQPYRIVSFIMLGMILLGASFVYNKQRHLFLKEDGEADPDVNEPIDRNT